MIFDDGDDVMANDIRDGWGLSFPDFLLRKKSEPEKLTRPGIEPGPDR